MTERSRFWDGSVLGDCGPYTQTHFHNEFFRAVLNGTGNRGPLLNWRNGLEVTGVSSPISVDTGGACVYGGLYDSDSAITVNVSTPSSGNSRYDRIVVRRDWSAQTIRIARVVGVAAAAPAVPALTQTAGSIYEIPLANALVDDAGAITVTDTREFCAYTTDWPANTVIGSMIVEDAVTLDKIPDRTRYELKGSGQIEPDATTPASWIAGPSWDYWEFTKGGPANDSIWTYWLGPTGLVGNIDFYLWTGPTAVAAGDVKWNYNIYYGTGGGALANATGTVLVAQGGRAVGNVYRDQIVAALAAGEGQIIAFQLTRDDGHANDTYANHAWLIGVEMSLTADA
jgi:hypothetical protein